MIDNILYIQEFNYEDREVYKTLVEKIDQWESAPDSTKRTWLWFKRTSWIYMQKIDSLIEILHDDVEDTEEEIIYYKKRVESYSERAVKFYNAYLKSLK